MLRRFLAAAVVPSVAIACGALGTLILSGLSAARVFPLLLLWCMLPGIWGAWALAAPATWVPQRLPTWGAMLGFLAAMFGAFVLDMPLRVFGLIVPAVIRFVGVVAVSAIYYLLWMVVRAVYEQLAPTPTHIAVPQGGMQSEPCAEAAQHVSDAYQLLGTARDRYQRHPELDEAIARLESALALLTIKTGGML